MQTSLLLDMMSDNFPERMALGSLQDGISYGELARRAKAGAGWLSQKPGEIIVYLGLNNPSIPITLFASGYIGRPFAPINYRLKDDQLRAILARTAPSTLIVDDDMAARVAGVADVEVVTRSEFEAACQSPDNLEIEIPFVDPDVALWLFTSGTTGEPKVAILRHANLTSYVISTVEFANADESDAALVSVPPYHIAGMSAILTSVYSGRRMVYLTAFTPEEWVDVVAQEKILRAMVVPTMLDRILDVLETRGQGLPDLKALTYGGGRMPLLVIERAMKSLPHVNFVNAYGLTETSSTISLLGPEDHREAMASNDPAIKARLGSVGQPIPSLEVEIRDEAGQLVPAGTPGEIYVRGEQISGEYKHKKLTDDAGWFATNDGGYFDEGGYLYVTGRLDDVIVRGGENISPGEIEDVLLAHPSVGEVAVLGVKNIEWGEALAAVIVPENETPDKAELADWVKSRLRSTKTPQLWEFRDELPYNDTGKVLRRILKSELENR